LGKAIAVADTNVRDVVEELEISDDEARMLIATYIHQDPSHPGRHEAWTGSDSSGAQVWHLIPQLRNAGLAKVARDWCLSEETVLAAIAYYRHHRALFDAKLLLEEEESSQFEVGIAEGWITGWQPVRIEA
jgi:hypothetical protein